MPYHRCRPVHDRIVDAEVMKLELRKAHVRVLLRQAARATPRPEPFLRQSR